MNRWVLLMSSFLVACATAPGSRGSAGLSNDKTKGGFPTREAIAEIRALDHKLEADAVADVETWDYLGPFPAEYSNQVYNDAEPWTQQLLQLYQSSQGNARPTVAMNCVSRELARFVLSENKQPALALKRDLAGRCRSVETSFAYQSISYEIPETTTDEALWAEAGPRVGEILKIRSTGRPVEMGLSYYRDAGRAIFLFAYAPRRLVVNSVERTQGGYVVQGERVGPIRSIRTLTTVGAYGAAECADVITVKPPQFAVECPSASDDDDAWIEVAVFEGNAVFGTVGAAIRVHPSGAEPPPYRRPEVGRDAVVSSGAELSQRFLELINEVRKGAGHGPLVLDTAQSAEAAEVTMPYFASALGRLDPMVGETVLLGMRAGWSVEETVRYGEVASAMSVGVPNLSALLANILDGPFGRTVLLDPQMRRAAIGPLFEARLSLYGTLVATYALFDAPKEEIRERVVESISAARSIAGRKPVAMLPELDTAVAAADAAIAGGTSLDEALDALMKAVAKTSPTGARGYAIETPNLDQLEWPKELVITDARVVIAVGHRKTSDEPWGRHVVLIAYEQIEPTTTALLGR